MQLLQVFTPINQPRVLQILEKRQQIPAPVVHGRALRHETVRRHARLRVRADVQVPARDRVVRVRGGARVADGLEVVGGEPDHYFRFVGVAAGVVGDEGVVGDVGVGGGGVVAVEFMLERGTMSNFSN